MKRIRTVGLCLVAAFAFGALVASAAQAAGPEWGRCVSVKKGFYSDSNCQTRDESKGKPKGKFEWLPGAQADCVAQKAGKYKEAKCETEDIVKGKPKGKYEKTGGGKFTGKGGAGVLSAAMYECDVEEVEIRAPRADCEHYVVAIPHLSVECTSEAASGEATGTNQVTNVSVLFKGCKLGGSLPCNSAGAGAGEIHVNPLVGRLGYIEKTGAHVGVLLEPAAVGGKFAEIECEGTEELVVVGVGNATEGAYYTPEATGGYDGIISPITPINKMTPTFTQNYTVNANHENVPSHFEGEHIELLESYLESLETHGSLAWSPAGQEITNVNTVEGEAEIKA
ncbi:MAG: hypothetical protein ACLPUT_04860 [Solirubrobacteraceae bacterium]